MIIWFATGNAHKRAELADILPGYTIRIPADGGVAGFDPEETGVSFAENALLKARALYRTLIACNPPVWSPGEPVVADDSGLCVDALDGRPGIFSARYGSQSGAAARLNDAERNALLLEELGNAPLRTARFVCAMVLLWDETRYIIAQETLEGEIVSGPVRGRGGFGYDPILYLPSLGCTLAELTGPGKNALSHRGKAGRLIARILDSSKF